MSVEKKKPIAIEAGTFSVRTGICLPLTLEMTSLSTSLALHTHIFEGEDNEKILLTVHLTLRIKSYLSMSLILFYFIFSDIFIGKESLWCI